MRILSLLPSATEIVYALGLEDDLVGVTHECDWPPAARAKRSVSFSALPPAAEPAEVDRLVSASIDGGEPIYRLDNEAVRELRPDLVLTQDLCAVCAVPSGHVNDALELLGCRAEVLSMDPELTRRGARLHPARRRCDRDRERPRRLSSTACAAELRAVADSVAGSHGPGPSRSNGPIRRSTGGTGCPR